MTARRDHNNKIKQERATNELTIKARFDARCSLGTRQQNNDKNKQQKNPLGDSPLLGMHVLVAVMGAKAGHDLFH